MKQCVCGRSNTYPYCDGTHKIKKEKPQVAEEKTNDDSE